MGEIELFSNEQIRRVKWSDCDPAGIIFNPNYYRWMDDGAFMLLKAAGFELKQCKEIYPGLIGWPLVKSGMEFFRPPSYGVELIMRSQVSDLGKSSFVVEHSFLSLDRTARYASGTETRVWATVDPDTGRGMCAAPMPTEFKAALEKKSSGSKTKLRRSLGQE